MEYTGTYEESYGAPFRGCALQELKVFLAGQGLSYDYRVGFTVLLRATDGSISATGSLDGSMIKCVATARNSQGEGLCARVVSLLVTQAAREGRSHLFLFTKPGNCRMFGGLGFYPIVETDDVLLMENRKNGIQKFVAGLENPLCGGRVGTIVANCNPFTNGHLYLVERAAQECALVHFFLLSEDRSAFPAAIRYRLAKEAVAHLPNVLVHPTADYLISSATFPTYFLKDKVQAEKVNGILDLATFCECFAGPLHIAARYVGEEPYCAVTRAYNAQMKAYLPKHGVEVVEVGRCELGGEAISASGVRMLMAQGRYVEIAPLVPKTTYDFILSDYGGEIANRLKTQGNV